MLLNDTEEICFEFGITLFELEVLVSKTIAAKFGFYGTACYLNGYVVGFKQATNTGNRQIYQRKAIKLTQKNRNELSNLVLKALEEYIPFAHIQRIHGFFAENQGCVRGIIRQIECNEMRVDFLDLELHCYCGKMILDDRYILGKDLKAGKYRVGQILYFAIAENQLTVEHGRFSVLLKRADKNIVMLHLRKALARLEQKGMQVSVTIKSISFAKNLMILKMHNEISPYIKGFLSKSLGMGIKYIS